MLDRLYDLQRQAVAHEEDDQVHSIYRSRCALYHRLDNAAEAISTE